MKFSSKSYQMTNEGKTFWVIESTQLKGCVAQGDTYAEALADFEANETVWLETANEVGIPIPQQEVVQTEQTEYSGKFTVRVSKSTHKRIAELAEAENISLNQFVNEAISEKIGSKLAVAKMERQVERLSERSSSDWKIISDMAQGFTKGSQTFLKSITDEDKKELFSIAYSNISQMMQAINPNQIITSSDLVLDKEILGKKTKQTSGKN